MLCCIDNHVPPNLSFVAFSISAIFALCNHKIATFSHSQHLQYFLSINSDITRCSIFFSQHLVQKSSCFLLRLIVDHFVSVFLITLSIVLEFTLCLCFYSVQLHFCLRMGSVKHLQICHLFWFFYLKFGKIQIFFPLKLGEIQIFSLECQRFSPILSIFIQTFFPKILIFFGHLYCFYVRS